MVTPFASQANQHQAAWYKHMSLAHSQERIAHPGFIAHDHAHSSLPPVGSRVWPFPPVVIVPVPLATPYLLPMETGFGASTPSSGLLVVDASDQPPRDPASSAHPTTATPASSSASGSMDSSTPSPVLTADDITRIVNKCGNAGLADAASAVPVRAPPHGFDLKKFSGASKDWINYNRYLTYAMEMPPFALGMAELKTTTANVVQSSQLRTNINTVISGDNASHFESRNNLIGKGLEMVSILRTAYAPTFSQIFGMDM